MEVEQICKLGPGTPVWVWIVRVGKGRWWPGSVLSIAALKPFPIVDTRFECCSAGRNGADGPAFVGISTTRMRYLELRDPQLRGADRPSFIPNAIVAKPEKTSVGIDDAPHADTMNADAQAPGTSAVKKLRTSAVTKLRTRKKTKASNPAKNMPAAAIEP